MSRGCRTGGVDPASGNRFRCDLTSGHDARHHLVKVVPGETCCSTDGCWRRINSRGLCTTCKRDILDAGGALPPRRNSRKPVPAEWEPEIEAHLAFLKLRDLTDQTIELRGARLGNIARALHKPPFDVTLPDLLAYFTRNAHWARNTVLSTQAAIVVFYGWAVKVGRTTTNPAADLPKLKPPKPKPKPVPEDDYAAALAAADPRVSMAMRIMGGIALRRTETAQIHRDDLIQTPEGWLLKVLGKGRKERIVPVPRQLASDMLAWIDTHGHDGYAFPAPGGGHITPPWLGRLVSRALPAGYTGHKLRHRALTRTYDTTKDIILTATLAGHSSVATTQAYYVEPNFTALRHAVEGIAS